MPLKSEKCERERRRPSEIIANQMWVHLGFRESTFKGQGMEERESHRVCGQLMQNSLIGLMMKYQGSVIWGNINP